MNVFTKKIGTGLAVLTLAGFSTGAIAASIGAILPLTGASASIGDDQMRGIQLALDKINAEGGVLGEPFEVIIEDSGGRTPTALDAAKKLLDINKVPIILGEYSSGITIPVAQYVINNGGAHLNIGSSSDKLRELPRGSYSMLGLDDVSSTYAAEDILRMGHKTAVIIAPNNAYGQGVEQHLRAAFEERGGKIISTTLYTAGQSTYRRELQQLARADADIFVYSAYGQEASVINREAFDLGLNEKPWYGIYLTMCTTDTPAAAAEGQFGIELSAAGDQGQSYLDAHQAKYNEGLRSTFSSYAYDAVMLAARVIEMTGGTDDHEAILNAIEDVGQGYEAVTGRIEFDENGQRKVQPYTEVMYSNGAVVPRN